MGTSRLGGVPTVLEGADPAGQLRLALPGEAAVAPTRHEPRPGVVHIRGWLGAEAQHRLVENFRDWSRPPAGLRHPRVPAGHLMTVQSVCLGWHWRPYAYSRTADDTDGAPVKPLPAGLAGLARAAVADAYGAEHPDALAYEPDAAIVNFYEPAAHLGLHTDGEEPSPAPVVTISVGDDCLFRLAGVGHRNGPFTDLTLASGDLLVFGGEQRRVYHGVPRVFGGTAPPGLGLPAGRLSITVRQTGLD